MQKNGKNNFSFSSLAGIFLSVFFMAVFLFAGLAKAATVSWSGNTWNANMATASQISTTADRYWFMIMYDNPGGGGSGFSFNEDVSISSITVKIKNSATEMLTPHIETFIQYGGGSCTKNEVDGMTSIPANYDGFVTFTFASPCTNIDTGEYFYIQMNGEAGTSFQVYGGSATTYGESLRAHYGSSGTSHDAALYSPYVQFAGATFTPPDGVIDFTSPLIDYASSPQDVLFEGTYNDSAADYDRLKLKVVNADNSATDYFIIDIDTPDCTAGVCNFSFTEKYYAGDYSYSAYMGTGAGYVAEQTNASWTFLIPQVDNPNYDTPYISINRPATNEDLPAGDVPFNGVIHNCDTWLADNAAYDEFQLTIHQLGNHPAIYAEIAMPTGSDDCIYRFTQALTQGTYTYDLYAYDTTLDTRNGDLKIRDVPFTVGNPPLVEWNTLSNPSGYCDLDFTIFNFNSTFLSVLCTAIIPTPTYFPDQFAKLDVNLRSALPLPFEFYGAMTSGFNSLGTSTTAPSQTADNYTTIGGQTVPSFAVIPFDFNAFSSYMGTFRGYESIILWMITIFLCYERITALLDDRASQERWRTSTSPHVINLAKGERIN